jgi:hypothetical protein
MLLVEGVPLLLVERVAFLLPTVEMLATQTVAPGVRVEVRTEQETQVEAGAQAGTLMRSSLIQSHLIVTLLVLQVLRVRVAETLVALAGLDTSRLWNIINNKGSASWMTANLGTAGEPMYCLKLNERTIVWHF